MGGQAVVEVHGLRKQYLGFRSLRVERLVITAGDHVAILGFDAVSAEVFVNLLTAAILPDAGDIRVFGESTKAVTTEAAWLQSLDRLGIVTRRAVLPSGFSLAQNLALPFTVQIDPILEPVAAAVTRLAADVGLSAASLRCSVGELDAETTLRAHVARAVALDPGLLLLEHPTADLPRARVGAVASDLVQLATRRRLTLLALTADPVFARAVARRALVFDAARGALTPQQGLLSQWVRWWRS